MGDTDLATRGLSVQQSDLFDNLTSKRTIAWVDGVNSVVMAHMALMDDPNIILAHCDLGESVHEDSHRFINDVEQWLGKEIVRLRSTQYATIDEVFEKRRYLSGINGAPCTGEMKIVPRLNFQLPSDTHLWGYTADKLDAKRFDRMLVEHPNLRQRSPLIEIGLKKKGTHAILAQHGIKRPWVYEIGMPNGNCPGCVKSSSPFYWALIRKWFPVVFWRRDAQCRKFGAKIVIIGREKGEDGKVRNIRCYPSDIPADHSTVVRSADFGGCGFHCPTELAA
ncbi:hypothetical protein Sbs19_29110 [Sphingobium sp. BS19]|nr:hypothetical protein Sbs19_29110 [Sphingobium sp. BS19]